MRVPIIVVAILSMGAAHAGLIVAPNANAGSNGNTEQFALFGEGTTPVEFQWQFAASQLTGMAGSDVTGIGFRLPGGSTSISAGTSIGTWTLELSGAANSIGSMSTTFANNIGTGATTVLSGGLTLPGITGGAGPNPFFLIPFMTPFSYSGGDLVMTLIVNNASSFSVDANGVDTLGDTVGQIGGASPNAQFFNYPITEFQFGPVPEPASLLLTAAGVALIAARRALRARANRL